jgi:hypothetical protein
MPARTPEEFDIELPHGELIVVTGVSGSGKSSLVFDTLYAEGQRRYVETFSPYARQFLDRCDSRALPARGHSTGDRHRPSIRCVPALNGRDDDGDQPSQALLPAPQSCIAGAAIPVRRDSAARALAST